MFNCNEEKNTYVYQTGDIENGLLGKDNSARDAS